MKKERYYDSDYRNDWVWPFIYRLYLNLVIKLRSTLMLQKFINFIQKYIFGKDSVGYTILGIRFDQRKWYYLTEEYERNDRDWNQICFWLSYEIVDSNGNIGPDAKSLPWHWRFAYAIKNWPLRKPLGWIAIGWLLRAIVGA
jgi:hypothetical protein